MWVSLFARPPCASRVVSDLPAVRRIAREALQDMQANNVRYAELRTTPRQLADGTGRRDYIENVLRVFREFESSQAAPTLGACGDSAINNAQGPGNLGTNGGESLPPRRLIPRLLLSIDRGKSAEEAMVVAELAVELRASKEWGPFVVGVDFSGNPTKGAFKDFRSGITRHCY